MIYLGLSTAALSGLLNKLLDAARADKTQPEVKQAWVDWRASAEDIVISFKNHHLLEREWKGPLERGRDSYTNIVVSSLYTSSPLFDEHFHDVPVSLS